MKKLIFSALLATTLFILLGKRGGKYYNVTNPQN